MTDTFVGVHRAMLGESPLWDPRLGLIWWVDAIGQQICRSAPDGGDFRSWDAPGIVGSIGLARNGLIAALRDGFYLFDPATEEFTPVVTPEADNLAVRFNDGKTDRQGRFLSGTMRFGGAEGALGKLYRLENDGAVTILESDIQISNAICFSPAGDTLYFADSLQHCIWAYDYGQRASNRRVLIDLRPLGSPPDGATVDADGNLWVALVMEQAVACISPQGDVLHQVALPVPFPTCPAFGGDDLGTLFVTSIRDSKGLIVSDHPDAGRLMAVTGLGVTGIAEPYCSVQLPEQV
jgi:L-arabinonolactonase